MLCEYVDNFYLPAARSYVCRTAQGDQVAKSLAAWRARLDTYWSQIHFGNLTVDRESSGWHFRVHVYLGELSRDEVRVELYADPLDPSNPPLRGEMVWGSEIVGALHTYIYELSVSTDRPAEHFTPRIVGHHHAARIPLEAAFIHWQA
jgi:glycogen phosphorylase